MSGTFIRTRVVLGEHVGWMGGPLGVWSPPLKSQNRFRIRPMMPQPTTALTPSITLSAGLRIAKA